MASRSYGMEVELTQVDKPFNISGKYKLFDKPVDEISDVFDDDAEVETAFKIRDLIDEAGDVFSISAGGKAVVLAGDTAVGGTANTELLHIYYVHDANGDGDVLDTGEVAKVGVSVYDFDLDTLTTDNFTIA